MGLVDPARDERGQTTLARIFHVIPGHDVGHVRWSDAGRWQVLDDGGLDRHREGIIHDRGAVQQAVAGNATAPLVAVGEDEHGEGGQQSGTGQEKLHVGELSR
uniref:(northern house mosquito) hypothetical protein n=1 Tax=Culex pipiens TaxID=7175 RepID=A0A8D8FGR6_CULPI